SKIRHLPVHGWRAQQHRYLRSETGAEKIQWATPARELWQGDQPIHERRYTTTRLALAVQTVRPERPARIVAVSTRSAMRRRHLLCTQFLYGKHHPRTRH